MTPLTHFINVDSITSEQLGLQAIKQGKVGTIIVAGGEGTRLGHAGPKGTFTILDKSLFEYHIQTIMQAQADSAKPLPVAIMTSPQNHDATVEFFRAHRNFGLSDDQLSFFTQSELPFRDEEGHEIRNSKGETLKGPAGNGWALKHFIDAGIWKKWSNQGVESITFVLVDNILSTPFDARWIGYHLEKAADVTLKAIQRIDPLEKVGVLGEMNGQVAIQEYSEMSEKDLKSQNSQGELLFSYANISLFAFSMDFIVRIPWETMPLHSAYKLVNPEKKQWGYKYERFIFDLLPFSEKTEVIIYPRESTFAPLKEPKDVNFITQLIGNE